MKEGREHRRVRGANRVVFLWPAVLLCIAFVLGTVTFSWVYLPWRLSLQQLDKDRQQYIALRRSLAHARDRQRYLQEMQKGLRWLMDHRVLGPEQRLEWVDLLTAAADSKAVKLHYSIAPQRDFEWQPPSELRDGAYTLRASRMVLAMEVLHEGHWLNLLDGLEQRAPGWFGMRQCVAGFKPGAGAGDLPLAVECSLDWLSITPRGAAHRGAESTQNLLP